MQLPKWVKRFYYPILMIFVPKTKLSSPNQNNSVTDSIYKIPLRDIDGNETTLAPFKGKKILIVNVASECGFTHQYEQLQELYELHSDKIVVLGFPTNDFGAQEPGNNSAIKFFCTENYKVTFPMFEKTNVVGENKNALYKWLCNKEQNGWNDKKPKWNFYKYLINENGALMNYFSETVSPFDEAILKQIGVQK